MKCLVVQWKIKILSTALLTVICFLCGCQPAVENTSNDSLPQPIMTDPVRVTPPSVTPTSENAISWESVVFDNDARSVPDVEYFSSEDQPWIQVIDHKEDLNRIKEWVTEEHYRILNDIRYSEWIVVGIFTGRKGWNGYSIRVNTVEQQEGVITVAADDIRPVEGQIINPIETWPYYFIRINRLKINGATMFQLRLNGEMISAITKE